MGTLRTPDEGQSYYGPDPEIETLGQQYEASRLIHPNHKLTFEQFIVTNTRAKSNDWAYLSNRQRGAMLFHI